MPSLLIILTAIEIEKIRNSNGHISGINKTYYDIQIEPNC
jgi:hypothetical protein